MFPSLYEGYGLPVAEALACGAPVLAADASSLPEIVGPEALFDPSDPEPIAAAIERGLTDEGLRSRLLAASGRAPTSWAEVAAATMDVYSLVLDGELPPPGGLARRPAQARRRLAFAGPLPPDGGPVADWNLQLLEALAGRADLDVEAFADRPAYADRKLRPISAPSGVPVHPLASLEAVEGVRGPFDNVVYSLADDEHHTGCLAALRRRRDGIVVTHHVALSDLYGHAARSGALPEGLQKAVTAAYRDGVHPLVGAHDTLPRAEGRRLGILLVRDVLAHCRRLVVMRAGDAALADLDATPADRAKIHLTGDDPRTVADALYELSAAGS